jgi:hypothetical protein
MYADCFGVFFSVDSGHGGQTPDLDGDEVDGCDGRSPFHRFAFLPMYPT